MRYFWAVFICVVGGSIMAAPSYAQSPESAIGAAISAKERLARDLLRDSTRHPQAVLTFFDVAPGQRVLDLFSGGGYYSELLARVVGEQGSVVVHNNQAYLPYAKQELLERDYATRIGNVELLISEADDLTLAPSSFDRIFFILGFHDMFYQEPGWPAINSERLLAHLFASVKPGGLVAIIDHDAPKGSTVDTAQSLHRLAKEHVMRSMQAAGFEWVGSLAVLENPDDAMLVSAFDQSVKGKTNRYVLKFRRPKT